jgi:hypothetical protein
MPQRASIAPAVLDCFPLSRRHWDRRPIRAIFIAVPEDFAGVSLSKVYEIAGHLSGRCPGQKLPNSPVLGMGHARRRVGHFGQRWRGHGEVTADTRNCPETATKLPGGGHENCPLAVVRSARHESVCLAASRG